MRSSPPTIFSDRRRVVRRQRAFLLKSETNFIVADMVNDLLERLAFTQEQPEKSLIVGDTTGVATSTIPGEVYAMDINGEQPLNLEAPYPHKPYDLVAVLGLLDTVNDLPGALLHIRDALRPGGLAIASFVGGASLQVLRRAMFEAEAERPAARMHPLIDIRAVPQLLQRAGWHHPVVDSHTLRVRYSSFDRLISDLREMSLGSVLASPAPPLSRRALATARTAFEAQADADGKIVETFEILTLTGRRSLAGT